MISLIFQNGSIDKSKRLKAYLLGPIIGILVGAVCFFIFMMAISGDRYSSISAYVNLALIMSFGMASFSLFLIVPLFFIFAPVLNWITYKVGYNAGWIYIVLGSIIGLAAYKALVSLGSGTQNKHLGPIFTFHGALIAFNFWIIARKKNETPHAH
jgi:hypothetical protein